MRNDTAEARLKAKAYEPIPLDTTKYARIQEKNYFSIRLVNVVFVKLPERI